MSQNPYGARVQMSFGPPMTKVVKIFIIACAAIFGLEFLLKTLINDDSVIWLFNFFGLVPNKVIRGFVWQPITFNLLHANFWHLFFNMFAIWMFGASLEQTLGPRRTITYFAITGIGAGLLNIAVMPIMQKQEWGIPSIGASGIAYGVLFAYGYLWPKRRILIMFLFPLEARWLVIIYGAIELVYSIQMIKGQGGTGIGHIAHLGGMLFGFLYLRYGVLYHKLREAHYRRKLKKVRSRFDVINGDKDDGPTIH